VPEYETIDVTIGEDAVALVELNRPDVLNAVNMEMFADLPRVFADLDEEASVSVIVLAGRGRAFSVGADMKERPTMSVEDIRSRRQLAPAVFGSMSKCSKPVIAAVAGYALGGGCELALACDLIVAEESAVFALPETQLGVIPGGGATQRLPRLVGLSRAKDLILSGRRFSAADAERWGMVNHLAPDGDGLARAQELARELAANAPVALAQAKRALDASQSLDLEGGIRFEAEAALLCLEDDGWRERQQAARERRAK
jgi:enoyl-CoA hydratase/carnithine racemase